MQSNQIKERKLFLFIHSTSPGKITRMTCIQYKYNIIQVTNGGDTTTVEPVTLWALLTYRLVNTYKYLETTVDNIVQTSTRVTI
jgi:hypothetical protein